MQSFQDKNVVITGGASGVGKALAMRLGREGAQVLIADIEPEALDKALADIQAAGIRAHAHVVDVASRDQVFALADKAFSLFDEVDCVFNNAGVGGGGGATNWEVPEKAWRWAFEVNFFGPLYGIQAFVPRMLAQNKDAVIAATSSGAGLVFPPMAPAYCCSKSALISLYETLSHQLQMMSARLQVVLLFPGPHVINSALMNSQRNVQPEFADEKVLAGNGITDIPSFQKTMKMFLGHEVELTEPEEFADYTHDAILDGKFWVMPMTEVTRAALRLRVEEMLTETGPSIPKMM